jgi:hypothetical protein
MMPIALGTASNQPEKIDMNDNRIITNAMIRAQDQERIALLEGLLKEAMEGLDDVWITFDHGKSVVERIRAALGEVSSEDMPPEFSKVVSEDFYSLIGPESK